MAGDEGQMTALLACDMLSRGAIVAIFNQVDHFAI